MVAGRSVDVVIASARDYLDGVGVGEGVGGGPVETTSVTPDPVATEVPDPGSARITRPTGSVAEASR